MIVTVQMIMSKIFRNQRNHIFYQYLKYSQTSINIWIKLIYMLSTLLTHKPKYHEETLRLLRNQKINTFTPLFIIQMLDRQALIQLEQFMKKQKTLNITQFMRFFRKLLPVEKDLSRQSQFFINYGLFKMFEELCYSKKKLQVTFSEISSFMAQKMPTFENHNKIQEKLLPMNLQISEGHRKNIVPPAIYGKVVQDRIHFNERPLRSDRIQHLNRAVGQAEYSKKFRLYFYIDIPCPNIQILDDQFNYIESLKTQQDISKRDMIVNFIAWSDEQQKIACLLGNYSISMWSKQDNFKYEVNIPLGSAYLANPFIGLKYMVSMRKWIAYDNRPGFYVLSNRNYQPEYIFYNKKIKKVKQTQKVVAVQLKYYSLLCVGFQRSIFLISFNNKEIVSELNDLKTSITSITFSESFQALFISTYESYFKSYELTQFEDLLERGRFQGHKSQISLLGTIEKKPIVFSIQENSILKMFDMRDHTCYQSFSVLKNVAYKQILSLDEGICLVGSKLNVYNTQKEFTLKEKQDIIYLDFLHRNIIVVTNKCVRVYDVRNGALLTVVKAIFGSEGSTDIYSVYLMDSRDKLVIQNEDGECKILQTSQMSEITTWQLDPKPIHMYYDDDNQLITQVSLGTIHINQYSDSSCQKQIRRKIIHDVPIRYIKVCQGHDLICVIYEDDDNLYFYAYEKGKILGYVNLGQNITIHYKNSYIPPKTIPRIIQLQFLEGKNGLYILLSDRLLFATFKKTASDLSFIIHQEIQLWQQPIIVNQITIEKDLEEQPFHSTGFAIFDDFVIVASNQASLFVSILINYSSINIQKFVINRENYNPYRVGFQNHQKTDHLSVSYDISEPQFEYQYYHCKQRLGNTTQCVKLGNLLLISDDNLNLVLWQYPNWNNLAGHINLEYTLPKKWEIFKFSDKQVKEVQYVLRFMDNQEKSPMMVASMVLSQTMEKSNDMLKTVIPKITISELITENLEKTKGMNSYRSHSLREKKMILEKQRDQKEKNEIFEEHQKSQLKGKQTNTHKKLAHKQIVETLGYLSVTHNDTILKRGIVEVEIPQVNALQKKLNQIMYKDEKKSITTQKSGLQSLSTHRKHKKEEVMQHIEKLVKFNQSEIKLGSLSDRFGSTSFKSRQFINHLKAQRSLSQKKINPLFRISSQKNLPSKKRKS